MDGSVSLSNVIDRLPLCHRSNEEFPSNVELQRLREKQSYGVPIIIAVVSESLSVHFSICTFK